jgi:aminoglycoside 6'-N-acetyltransferase I
MMVRPVQESDADEWMRLRLALWPEADPIAEKSQIERFLTKPTAPAHPTLHAVFVCERPDGGLRGMVEASIRPYADGCETTDVGYLEAWYVDPDSRRQGIGRKLVTAAETWALEQGCREMASDADLSNLVSQEAHQHLGYAETGRVIQYCKPLKAESSQGST